MEDIWVRDCMTKDVITCSYDTVLEEVVAELHNRFFSCLIIVENKKPIGIITERDLISIFSNLLDQQDWRNLMVADYMMTKPRVLYEDLTLMEAVDQMRLERLRSAPIINNLGELVGILTHTDIIKGFYNAFKNIDDVYLK